MTPAPKEHRKNTERNQLEISQQKKRTGGQGPVGRVGNKWGPGTGLALEEETAKQTKVVFSFSLSGPQTWYKDARNPSVRSFTHSRKHTPHAPHSHTLR